MTSELIACLARQERLLRQILLALNKDRLGFQEASSLNYIYCNRRNNCLWYRIEDDKVIVLTSKSFTGYLREIKFEKMERRGSLVWKMLTTFEANGSLYIFESGYDSNFSKSLLAVAAQLSYEQLIQPITIEPKPGKEAEVLFCTVFVGGENIYVEHRNFQNEQWRQIAKTAIQNIKAANKTFRQQITLAGSAVAPTPPPNPLF